MSMLELIEGSSSNATRKSPCGPAVSNPQYGKKMIE